VQNGKVMPSIVMISKGQLKLDNETPNCRARHLETWLYFQV